MATSTATAAIGFFGDDILIDPYPTSAALRDLGAVVHLALKDDRRSAQPILQSTSSKSEASLNTVQLGW